MQSLNMQLLKEQGGLRAEPHSLKKRREQQGLVAPIDAAMTGSGSSWWDLRALYRSAVACKDRDQISLNRGKCSVRSVSLLMRLFT